jgi:hypothetical protein
MINGEKCFMGYLFYDSKDKAGVRLSHPRTFCYLGGVVISVEVVQGLVVRVQVEVHVVVTILKLNNFNEA